MGKGMGSRVRGPGANKFLAVEEKSGEKREENAN